MRDNDPRILQVFLFPYTNIFLPDTQYQFLKKSTTCSPPEYLLVFGELSSANSQLCFCCVCDRSVPVMVLSQCELYVLFDSRESCLKDRKVLLVTEVIFRIKNFNFNNPLMAIASSPFQIAATP